MGRTLPTATMQIQQEEASWSKFRRALRKEDQDIFDALFRSAKIQLPAVSYEARPIVFESVMMAMLIAFQRRLNDVEQELRQLKERA